MAHGCGTGAVRVGRRYEVGTGRRGKLTRRPLFKINRLEKAQLRCRLITRIRYEDVGCWVGGPRVEKYRSIVL